MARALEKLPADRFESARTFAEALGNPSFATAGGARLTPVAGGSTGGMWKSMFAATTAVALVAIAGFIWALQRPAGVPDEPTIRVPVDLPPGDRLAPTASSVLAISPQGDLLAYLVSGPSHIRMMIRRTGELVARELAPGILTAPAFSPDGHWLAVVEGTEVRKVAVDGGSPVPLGSASTAVRGLAWSSPDTIILGTDRGLFAIASQGGTPRRVEGVDSASTAIYPVALGDGESIAYTTGPVAASRRIAVTSLTSHRTTVLETRAAIALGMFEGHLLYVTAIGELNAVPFDAAQQRVTGDPVQLENGVRTTQAGAVHAALSASGSLWYAVGQATGHLVRVTREGDSDTIVRRGASLPSPALFA